MTLPYEPTPGMVWAGNSRLSYDQGSTSAADVWRAMAQAFKESGPVAALPPGHDLVLDLAIDALSSEPPEGKEWPVNWPLIVHGLKQIKAHLCGIPIKESPTPCADCEHPSLCADFPEQHRTCGVQGDKHG